MLLYKKNKPKDSLIYIGLYKIFFYQLFTETPIVIVKWTRNPKKMVPSSENKYNMPDDVIN